MLAPSIPTLMFLTLHSIQALWKDSMAFKRAMSMEEDQRAVLLLRCQGAGTLWDPQTTLRAVVWQQHIVFLRKTKPELI